jgi:hypothetical protein
MKDLNANAGSIKAPLLMVHGTKDAVTSPDAAKAFAGSVGSSDVTLNMVEGEWGAGSGEAGAERGTWQAGGGLPRKGLQCLARWHQCYAVLALGGAII